MAQTVRLRRRRRLRRKEAEPVLQTLVDEYGMQGVDLEAPLEGAEVEHQGVFILDGRVVGLELDGRLAPALRGLLRWPASKRWVTVDMGAVRFVTNGADVMAPGITQVDDGIREGDPIWVRDETHGRPLAVGVALADAAGLRGEKGKVIANHHAVGDALWHVGDEE